MPASGGQSAQEALSHTPVDPDRVRRPIGVALQPNGQQFVIGPSIGVEGGQSVDLGTEDFGGRQRNDLKLDSSPRGMSEV